MFGLLSHLKLDFHSHLLPIASEISRIGDVQVGKTNRIDEKIFFALFAPEV